MASGLPVITTSAGNEGIGATPDEEIIVTDNAEEFARRTVELLGDKKRRQYIRSKGLEFVRKKFGWEETIWKLETIYHDCLS